MPEHLLMTSDSDKVYIVLGAKGYIGAKFMAYLDGQKKLVEGISRTDINYTDTKIFDEFLQYNQPRWKDKKVFVINCAGKTGRPNVDQCEVKKRETIDLNVVLPAMLSEVCQRHGAIFCHVSSGCIYSGNSKQIFTELDPPNFTFENSSYSFYSGSKAMAEEYVIRNSESYIWRIRMPFDEYNNKRNYLSKLMTYDKLISAKNSLTHIGNFIRTCSDMMERGSPYGIYNIVNPDGISTKEITTLISANWPFESTVPVKKFKFFPSIVQFNKTVNTPRSNCILSADKVNSLLGVTPMPSAKTAIEDALHNWH